MVQSSWVISWNLSKNKNEYSDLNKQPNKVRTHFTVYIHLQGKNKMFSQVIYNASVQKKVNLQGRVAKENSRIARPWQEKILKVRLFFFKPDLAQHPGWASSLMSE